MSRMLYPKDRIVFANPSERIKYNIRSSQAILQYGVGAMVDFPDQTLMTAAPEYWADKVIRIYDERLQRALGVDYLGMPGGSDEPQFREGISYVRFPQWYFCPKCRRFQTIKDWYKEYKRKFSSKQLDRDPYMKTPRCSECPQDLVVARIIVVCEHGHIDDFPWVRWTHRRNLGGPKKVCNNPQLTLSTGTTATAGLEGISLKCTNCEARATLYEAFDATIFARLDERDGANEFLCSGNQPWKHHSVMCGAYPRAMQRGASSVYFPKTVSSLVIPPYSDQLNNSIEKSAAYSDCQIKIAGYKEEGCSDEEINERINRQLDRWASNIAVQILAPAETIKSILERKLTLNSKEGDSKYQTDSVKYRAEEFDALTGIVSKPSLDTDDFVRKGMDIKKYQIPGLKSVSLIHKIREVRALTGFTRINPSDSSDTGENTPGFVSAKEPDTPWYPAYEVRGEGVFIEFDKKAIDDWADAQPIIQKRAREINGNYSLTFKGELISRNISPQFVFLHTLAHVLIRQLSFECGYNVASLRERIYCASEEEGKEMAGIFIYTASGDSEGTLGGLVRQGRPDALPGVFKKAVEGCVICSNDPVCICTEQGQGRDALNMAACHACSLLPETSCEEFNVLLDRAMLIGTFDHKNIGFYSEWISKG